MTIAQDVARRRTFAIISHPDAGKTTLTEKLLLFTGAIHIAGTVRARKASRYATSDWMEIEKERGISVASSVMQVEYRDCVINLLDTPGHQDFSEDTYRVLTAVEAALMVIDAAKGVETQTRRLLEVCRARNTPVLTFINKLDCEVRAPLDLLDEIERILRMSAVPLTWPVGMGKQFAGVVDLRQNHMRVFRPGADRVLEDTIIGLESASCENRFGTSVRQARQEIELIRQATPAFSRDAFLNGTQTPVFFGSALNNFGVREVLDAIVDLVPSPVAKRAQSRLVEPQEPRFAGCVFKIQANMNPAHRDRVAFIRVCAGRFVRGMTFTNCRSGKTMRARTVVAFLSQRREVVDEACAGDIIGIASRGSFRLGDTVTDGESLQFGELPRFAPEVFKIATGPDPLRRKQLQTGLAHFAEEGAIQVFRFETGTTLLLGAVGALQFDVVAHRLASEYGVHLHFLPTQYVLARWITADSRERRRFIEGNSQRVVYDSAEAPVFLATSEYELATAQKQWPEVAFRGIWQQADVAAPTVNWGRARERFGR
jgi:peptide chain release factor 3